MSSFNKWSVRIAAVSAVVAVVMLSGCGQQSIYENYYRKAEADKQQLELQIRQSSHEKIELLKQIDEFQRRESQLTQSATLQQRSKSEEEQYRKALLGRLQAATEGTPCEVVIRGEQFVVITRFSFEPGKAELDVRSRSDLRKIAEALMIDPFSTATFVVAGHADSSPIRESKFRTNRELSGARALAVMEYLVEECKMPNERVAYAGYGEFYPLADNASAEGRAKNRRVEIIIKP